MIANCIQEVPNIFSIYVRRRGHYLVDAHGLIMATIFEVQRLKNLQEGVEVEMSFRPRRAEDTLSCAASDANETMEGEG